MILATHLLNNSIVPWLCADEGVEACYTVLLELLDARHGSVLEISAIILRLLTPNVLGDAARKLPGERKCAAVRARALQFAKATLR